jgi:GNAT superfamily N-acetyltransferase
MSDFVVRLARPEDREPCAALYARVAPLAYPGQDLVIEASAFDADTEGEVIFVAERNGVIAAFAAHYAPGNFLHHLYVAPEAHRIGVGSALLRAVEGHAPDGLTLKVPPNNNRARAFYEKHGWTVCGSGDNGQGPWLLYCAPTVAICSPVHGGAVSVAD